MRQLSAWRAHLAGTRRFPRPPVCRTGCASCGLSVPRSAKPFSLSPVRLLHSFCAVALRRVCNACSRSTDDDEPYLRGLAREQCRGHTYMPHGIAVRSSWHCVVLPISKLCWTLQSGMGVVFLQSGMGVVFQSGISTDSRLQRVGR